MTVSIRRLAMHRATFGLGVLAGLTIWTASVTAALGRPLYDRVADLQVYLGAARALQAGQGLYDFHGPNGDPFNYPPLAVVAFWPLAHLPLDLAAIIWSVATLLAVGVITVVLVHRWPRPNANPRLLGVAIGLGLLISAPVQSDLRFGQVSVLVVAIAFLDAAEITPIRFRGSLIGLAAAIKLTPLLFVPYFLLRRRWGDAARALGAFAALGGLGWLLFPSASLTYWTGTIAATNRIGDLAALGNQSIGGVLLRLGVSANVQPVVWGLLVAIVVGCALGRAAALRDAGQIAPAAALVGCATLAASPVSWTHHQVWSVLAAMLLIGLAGKRRVMIGVLGLIVMTISIVDLASVVTTNDTALFVAANCRALFAAGICVAGFGLTANKSNRPAYARPVIGLAAIAVLLTTFALIPLPPQVAHSVHPASAAELRAEPPSTYDCAGQTEIAGQLQCVSIPVAADLPVNYSVIRDDRGSAIVTGGCYRSVARLEAIAAPGGAGVDIPLLRVDDGFSIFAVTFADGSYAQLRAFDASGHYLGDFGDKLQA